MSERHSKELLSALAAVAPGRPLREGLDRILKAGMGALIVIGDGPEVLNISSGGFLVNASFSPQRLSELAKTDGAIVLTPDAGYIARANVHLVPNPNVPTEETGTRHRTAERVARSIGVPVITASEDMAVLTVYTDDEKYQLESIPAILNRCNQALQTLERYKTRLTEATSALTALEVENLVSVRDVVTVLQRTEMVTRIADEVRHYLLELGTDGRLVQLQLSELMAGVDDERYYVARDYLTDKADFDLDHAIEALVSLETEELMDAECVAEAMHLVGSTTDLDESLEPRGYRILNRVVPPLGPELIENVVAHFGSLKALLRGSTEELSVIEGANPQMAQLIKSGVTQQAESSILTRYQ